MVNQYTPNTGGIASATGFGQRGPLGHVGAGPAPQTGDGLNLSVEQLQTAVAEQNEAITQLFNVLENNGLLRPSSPNVPVSPVQPGVVVRVSQRIDNTRQGVRHNTTALRELFSRLDI